MHGRQWYDDDETYHLAGRDGETRSGDRGSAEQRSVEPRSPGPAFAALDLGTNNCRMLVGTPSGNGFRVLDSYSRIVRLGEGLHHSGALCPKAMDRTVAALQDCAERLARSRPRMVRAIATEACRRARNGPEFLRPGQARDRAGGRRHFQPGGSRTRPGILHSVVGSGRTAGAVVRHRRRLDRTRLGARGVWSAIADRICVAASRCREPGRALRRRGVHRGRLRRDGRGRHRSSGRVRKRALHRPGNPRRRGASVGHLGHGDHSGEHRVEP